MPPARLKLLILLLAATATQHTVAEPVARPTSVPSPSTAPAPLALVYPNGLALDRDGNLFAVYSPPPGEQS